MRFSGLLLIALIFLAFQSVSPFSVQAQVNDCSTSQAAGTQSSTITSTSYQLTQTSSTSTTTISNQATTTATSNSFIINTATSTITTSTGSGGGFWAWFFGLFSGIATFFHLSSVGGPSITTDAQQYPVGGIINWQSTGWSQGTNVQAILCGLQGELSGLEAGGGTVGVADSTGKVTGTLSITTRAGSYTILALNIADHTQQTASIPVTVITPTQTGPAPKIWFSITPGGTPITAITNQQVYLQGSGWPNSLVGGAGHAAVLALYTSTCVLNSGVPSSGGVTGALGAYVNSDGTLNAQASGYLNSYAGTLFCPGSTLTFIGKAYGNNFINLGVYSDTITLPIPLPSAPSSGLEIKLYSNFYVPGSNWIEIDGTRTNLPAGAPTPSVTEISLSNGQHQITNWGIGGIPNNSGFCGYIPYGNIAVQSQSSTQTAFVLTGGGGLIAIASSTGCPGGVLPTGTVTASFTTSSIFTPNGHPTLTITPTQLTTAGGTIIISGDNYTPTTYPPPTYQPKPVVIYVSTPGNPSRNYGGGSWTIGGGGGGVNAQGHFVFSWGMSITIDSTWNFYAWDTGTNTYSNPVVVTVGAGTPTPTTTTTMAAYIPPTTPPTISIFSPIPTTNANGLPQLHLYQTYSGSGYQTDATVCFQGSGWGQNIGNGMYIKIYMEAQYLPIPGTPNPWTGGGGNINGGTFAGGVCTNLNNITWPNGQLLTFYGILMRADGTSTGVQSQPIQVMLV